MSGASYRILSGRAEGVYTDRRSRFLSYLQPVCAERDARVALDAIRAEHHAARHVCYAVVIDDPSLALSNDDGEPSGSAGRPILQALQRVGLEYTLGVVVRYFGGIKLGVPGLIAAYRGAVENALESANVEERIRESSLLIACPYGAVGVLMGYVKGSGGRIMSERYEAEMCHFEVAWPEGRVADVVAWTESYGVEARIEGSKMGSRVLPKPYEPCT